MQYTYFIEIKFSQITTSGAIQVRQKNHLNIAEIVYYGC